MEQDQSDEPASVLLDKIREEKEKLIKEGKIKKDKNESIIYKRDNSYYEKFNCVEKCIDDEIPFEIPESWEWCYVGNIAFVTKLAGFEYTKYIANNLKNKGIPLFKGKNIRGDVLVETFEGYIDEKISNELFRSQINKKCLLTPYVGSIGNMAIFRGNYKAHLGSNVGKIEILMNNLIFEEYLLFYFKSQTGYNELSKFKKATAQESISIDAIRNALIPLPPTNVQKNIIQLLDKLWHKISALNN